MNKSFLIAGMLLGVLTSAIKAESWYPHFVDNYIKVAAKGTRCGAFTITPKAGTGIITLNSYVFYSDTASSNNFSTDGLVATLKDLPAAGKKFRYDSAGAGQRTHYRIFCSMRKSTLDLPIDVNCADVVTIKSTAHNDACLSDNITGVGISAEEGYGKYTDESTKEATSLLMNQAKF